MQNAKCTKTVDKPFRKHLCFKVRARTLTILTILNIGNPETHTKSKTFSDVAGGGGTQKFTNLGTYKSGKNDKQIHLFQVSWTDGKLNGVI